MAAARRPLICVASKTKGMLATLLQQRPGLSVKEVADTDSDASLEEMRQSEVLLADPTVVEKVLEEPGRLKWAHSTWAAVDIYVSKWKDKPPNVLLTRNGYGFGQLMGEYVIGQILIREKQFLRMVDAQQQKTWLPPGWTVNQRPLTSLTIGVLGVGEIGGEVCRMCHSLGMQVWGMTRSPVAPSSRSPYIHQYRLQNELPELLSQCDYVCSVLPSTPETTGLLNGNVLQHCQKKKSVLINIGRGSLVSESELLKALKSGWLGGAVLDVFVEEPLPVDSPLWTHPGVTVTPHCSGVTIADHAVAGFLINYDLYTNGQELRWRCDFDRGY